MAGHVLQPPLFVHSDDESRLYEDCFRLRNSGTSVFTREELAKAIDEMIATDGPFLLEACVEEEGNVMPMTPPGGSVNQMLLEC